MAGRLRLGCGCRRERDGVLVAEGRGSILVAMSGDASPPVAPRFLVLTLVTLLLAPNARSDSSQVPCMEDGRFYRNPEQPESRDGSDCAKYYLCLDGEVFEFRCSAGLLFDVRRQLCDYKTNVDNCDVIVDEVVPKPLLEEADCASDNQLGCGDGTCIPQEYFCDGSVDCPDGSDEGWCDANEDPNGATPCDTKTCKLPDCFCSKDGTKIPGHLNSTQVPQMVVLTFDDAVNAEMWNLYADDLFTVNEPYRNPNGCPIRATFFLSHQYTNYQMVQRLWNEGHEIAVHSVTHRGPEDWWSRNATIEDWFDEMVGQANIINHFAGVRMEEIRGMRVPFLRLGWNRQFLMMHEFGFRYDASMVAPLSDPPIWPYSMDHRPPHKCVGTKQRCPSRAYPGLWELPLNQLTIEDFTCAMVDSCPPQLSGEDIYRMLTINFKRHYNSNRAPYGLYFHAAWFKRPEYLAAFKKFIGDMEKLPDVWFVTNWQVIEWIRNPTPVAQLNNFEPWNCTRQQSLEPEEIACENPKVCKLHSRILQGERYLHTCFDCPQEYPWIRNEFGIDS